MSRTRHKLARGGKAGGSHEYNAEGSPAMKAAEDKKDEFRKGGRAKKKHGGKVEGKKAHHRADHRPRHASGGRVRGPMSSAANTKARAGFAEGGTDKEND